MTLNSSAELLSLLDGLCPMHLVLDERGAVVHAGATLGKIFAPVDPVGLPFDTLFDLKRPRSAEGIEKLLCMNGDRVHLAFRGAPYTELKGVVMPLPADGPGCVVLNLSFGISLIEAVRSFNLTNTDFAVTDLATEMLYLHEANSAAMEASRQLTQRLHGAKIEAEKKAYTDTLTGLQNRRALEPLTTRLIEQNKCFALMHLDLDHFKPVNDKWGHAAGDHVLRQVAQILRRATRDDDMIIRAGGDEFVLIFTNIPENFDLSPVTARLLKALGEPIAYNDVLCTISASIGTTLSSDYTAPKLDQMMEDADLALYAAKSQGRARHVAYTSALRQDAASLTEVARHPAAANR